MAERDNVSLAIARAREDGFDAIALDALKIADYGDDDFVEDGEGNLRPNHELVQRSKLRVDTRLKLLAKWDPKRYGDKTAVEHSGSMRVLAAVDLTDEDLAKVAAGAE
jgi:hypothetical protein